MIRELPINSKIEDWSLVWNEKIEVVIRKNSFIYITDSFLKPFYAGELKVKPDFSPFYKFPNVDYDKDSEEEYEELHGEDINSVNDESEEESETESENEEINKFIVNDGYLSADERAEDEEIPNLSTNLNLEIQPMQLFLRDSKELLNFSAFSIVNQQIPIEIPKAPEKVEKEPKAAKMVVNENIEQEIISIALGKNSKDEIVQAAKSLFPLISKASVYKIIKTKLFKQKNGKIKIYKMKEEKLLNTNNEIKV